MLQDKLRICVWYPEIDAQCDCGMMRPSSNMKWNKTEELEPRNILCSATQHRRTVN